MTETAEQELIGKCLDGSGAAFDQLMIRYQEPVFRVALQFGKSRENAMDITQNVFLKAYENLPSFQGRSTFKTWLTRIAYNESNNWIRGHKKEINHEVFEEEMMITTNSPTQEDELLARENRSQLLRCLLELNTRYRLAVVLRYFENRSIREIAGTLDCSEGVVKNILFRSLRKLRDSLPVKN